ncbi:MAG: sigma-70 family RNA polymerase sigma factor [Sedimentisphaerales bacterium]|nr:sigma-70 family RNA polymerase sigma factor [Sedimentisphaerales bacterium]
MKENYQNEKRLIQAVCQGQEEAWAQLVDQYQGRLINFAMTRLPQRADAEDIVQDTFLAFIKGLNNFRSEVSLETYLFTILRNKIISRYRSLKAKSISLIQDLNISHHQNDDEDAMQYIPGPHPTASWVISQDEQFQLQQKVLSDVLSTFLQELKEERNFRDLKIADLIFYSRISIRNAAGLLDMNENTLKSCKHRWLKRIRQDVARLYLGTEFAASNFEYLLTDIWESHRLSCIKRSTLGAFLLESLEPDWFDYVDFHLTTLGCHFCRASFKDIKQQESNDDKSLFRQRIMKSTVGFLSRPH